MFFQKVLKGIADLSRDQAEDMVDGTGIVCNWWRLVGVLPNNHIKERLTEANLLAHLNSYDAPLPSGEPLVASHGAKTYGDITPFISTTAGAVQRDLFHRRNVVFPSFMTALCFATRNFTTNGYIFHGYVTTLGTQAIPLRSFGEEVRELHIYTQFLQFHHEGEIVAKIDIPPVQIEKAEEYDGSKSLAALDRGDIPVPTHLVSNSDFVPPEFYSNVRGLL